MRPHKMMRETKKGGVGNGTPQLTTVYFPYIYYTSATTCFFFILVTFIAVVNYTFSIDEGTILLSCHHLK